MKRAVGKLVSKSKGGRSGSSAGQPKACRVHTTVPSLSKIFSQPYGLQEMLVVSFFMLVVGPLCPFCVWQLPCYKPFLY